MTTNPPLLVERFESRLGSGYRLDIGGTKAIAFFGNRHSQRAELEAEFPHLKFLNIRQTHSDILIESPYRGEHSEADAHWTREKNLALAIRTADCVPILVVDLTSLIVVAIHAGWRGVENEIVVKSLRTLRAHGVTLTKAIAFIGPHIALPSFEVGLDVAEQLKIAYLKSEPEGEFIFHSLTKQHAHVDLDLIVAAQLNSMGISADRQHWLPLDTVTSPEHESFRRDRANSGRQNSFIAILK